MGKDKEKYEAKQKKKMDKYEDEVLNFSISNSSGIKDGIVMDRGCSDCLCTIIFLAFIGLMCYVTFYGISNGNIRKLMAPLDRNDNFCGIDTYRDYPNLYVTQNNFTS